MPDFFGKLSWSALPQDPITGSGALIFVAGWIRWRITWLDADVEEAVKDGKLTQSQAEKRAWVAQLATPVLMLIGLALLGKARLADLRDDPVDDGWVGPEFVHDVGAGQVRGLFEEQADGLLVVQAGVAVLLVELRHLLRGHGDPGSRCRGCGRSRRRRWHGDRRLRLN